MKKVSLASQIAAVSLARNNAGKIVPAGQAQLLAQQLAAAVEALQWCQRHETEIRAVMRQKGGAK